MAGKMYAKFDGTWPDLLAILKTAVDWAADEIVLVGVEGMEDHLPALQDNWPRYGIPMRLLPVGDQEVTDAMIDEPITARKLVFDIVPQQIEKTGIVMLNAGGGVPQPLKKSAI